MAQIRVQHFGPITDSGLIEIKKNTFFIGNQGSGKSTMAKLISLMFWLEKSHNRGDFSEKDFLSMILSRDVFKYHSIYNYIKPNKTRIDFYGDKFNIIIYPVAGNYSILENNRNSLSIPKIMYVPAERNFLSAIKSANKVTGLPPNLVEFAEELKSTQNYTQGLGIDLNIGRFKYKFDKEKEKSYIIGKDFEIALAEASSGLQSYTPLFLVSQRLSTLMDAKDNDDLLRSLSVEQSFRLKEELGSYLAKSFDHDEDLKKGVERIRAKYISKCFINIVEEPEQNLFPDSQWEVIKSLVGFNNVTKENKLIITTHSPYIINYLGLLVKGFQLHNMKMNDDTKLELEKIVPNASTIKPEDLVVYELNDEDGTVNELGNYKGIPSDENFLNTKMGDVNDRFDDLLDIEDQCL